MLSIFTTIFGWPSDDLVQTIFTRTSPMIVFTHFVTPNELQNIFWPIMK